MGKYNHGIMVLLLASGLSGCMMTSENPLPKSGSIDPALLGIWESQPDEKEPDQEKGHFLITQAEGGFLQLTVWEKNFEQDETYRGFCSRIGNEGYMNLKQLEILPDKIGVQTAAEYLLVHYEIKNQDQLEIRMLDEAFFRQAVKANKLAGRLSADKSEDVTLTASSDALAAFFSRTPKSKLLSADPPMRAKRVKPF